MEEPRRRDAELRSRMICLRVSRSSLQSKDPCFIETVCVRVAILRLRLAGREPSLRMTPALVSSGTRRRASPRSAKRIHPLDQIKHARIGAHAIERRLVLQVEQPAVTLVVRLLQPAEYFVRLPERRQR